MGGAWLRVLPKITKQRHVIVSTLIGGERWGVEYKYRFSPTNVNQSPEESQTQDTVSADKLSHLLDYTGHLQYISSHLPV